MNTIKIKGNASRKVIADRIRYRITFVAKDLKSSKASERAKNQCEVFLKDMKDAGFDISKFHMEKDNVTKQYNAEEKLVERTVSFEIQFNPKVNNLIYNIIRKEDLNVETETDFYLSNRNRIHNELLKEALLDSKEKAKMIAAANNQKILYAELITDNKYDTDYDDDSDSTNRMAGNVCGLLLEDDSLSADLSAKQIEERAELYITWVVE